MKRIAVITPTIATEWLPQAMHSVGQSAEHWVVVDGVAYAQRAVSMIQAHPYKQKLIVLPENTGTPTQGFNGLPYTGFFNGYRINAAIPLLINADYIMFLDEDNWYEPEHIPSMVEALEKNDWDWCYSLRRIVDKEGNFLFNDECDSLGETPSWEHGVHFVDMNCYLFKNCVISQIAHKMFDLVKTYDGDKNLYKEASNRYPNFGGTGLYTVNYRMTREGQVDWYAKGNKLKKEMK
jgi:glycosyltransferase involved in cell wall biosynthesis